MKQLLMADGSFAIVDAEDYERLSKHTWYAGSSVVRRRIARLQVTLAQAVMQNRFEKFDHKDRDWRNNCKSNLRPCTQQQNMFNKSKHRNTSSKYKGVTWDSVRKKWFASIRFNNKTIALGRYDNELLAALVYDVKARALFGAFVNPNFNIT